MDRIYWDSLTFAAGVNTHHAFTEAGDVFASEALNVRADGNGYLRLRQPTGFDARAHAAHAVTGLFSTQTHLFYLMSDGSMASVRKSDGRFQFVGPIVGTSGRLWMIDDWRDFYIGKSEGTDQGFWVDTRGDILQARALGLSPPALPSLSLGSAPSEHVPPGLYVYAITAVRAIFSDLDNVDLPPQVAGKLFSGEGLFNGMESNPTYFVVKSGGAVGDVYAGGELITHIVELPSNNRGLFLSGIEYDDPQQTGVYVYRTDVISTGTRARREDVEALEFRVTDFLFRSRPSDGGSDTAGTLHFGVDISSRPLMRKDNDRLPADAAQIAFYNDLVFAAVGDELRYSDVRDGAPVQWAFPLVNSVRATGSIVFCVEYRGVLLFGGPEGIWRFTGSDEFNFRRDQISSFGPVSRSAWALFENGVGFIGQAGLYITDGTSVQEIGSPFLDGFFDAEVSGGAVTRLPTGDEVFAVEYVSASSKQFFRSKRGGWFMYSDIAAKQFAGESDVLFVDGSRGVRTFEFRDLETIESALGWAWESQVIDFKEQGFDEAVKTFKWIEISASHSGEGYVLWHVDGRVGDLKQFQYRGDAQRPTRVRIDRRGERFSFRIFGSGEVVLRSIRVVADVRSGRGRF